MSDDDLRDLRAALDRATPRPEPSRRAADLARARAAFEALHRPAPRPGWRERLRRLRAPGAAGALAALAAGLVLVLPVGRDLLRAPPEPTRSEAAEDAQPYAEAAAEPEAEEAPRIKEVPEAAVPAPAPAPPPAPMARRAPAAADTAQTLAAPAGAIAQAGGYEALREAVRAGRPPPPVAPGDLLAAVPPDLSAGPLVLPAPWDLERTLVFEAANPSAGAAARPAPLAAGGGVEVVERPTAAVPSVPASDEARWGAAVVGWGLILQGDARTASWDREALLALARSARGPDPTGARAEAIDLMARSTAP